MYDTINLWLGLELTGGINLIDVVPYMLSNVKQTYSSITGQISFNGNLENLKVNVKEQGLFICGSICKYGLGDNMQTLTRRAGKEAIQNLSYSLGLPVERAKVVRMDLAENLIVRQPESVYYKLLGNANHYTRLEQNNGLYYNRGQKQVRRQMLFYGKVYEQKLKGVPINRVLENRNVLRYEIRFLRQLAKQFQRNEVLADTLFDECFYMEALNRWKDEYFKIYKHNLINFDRNVMNSLKEFDKQIYLLGLMALGGEAEALEIIENAKKQGIFNNKMQAGRLKEKIKSICNLPNLTAKSEAIQELDKKVKEAVRFYR